MLDKFRKKGSAWGTKLIFGVLALAFVFWAGGMGAGSNLWAAKVDGKTVPLAEFERRFRNQINQRRQQNPSKAVDAFQEKFIMRSVFESMIEEELLVQEAKKSGIVVSAEEIRGVILEATDNQGAPLFKDAEGKPVRVQDYQRILRAVGGDPKEYESRIERYLMRQKMDSFIRNSVKVTTAELLEEFKIRNEKVNLEFIKVTPEAFHGNISIDAGEIESFKTNKPDVIQAFYGEKLNERYMEPRRASLRRITIQKGEDEEENIAAKTRANQALEKAKTDFLASAEEYSEGANWEKTEDSRAFSERELEGALARKVFQLTPGSPPELIETPTSFVVAQVDQITEEVVTSLESVKGEIAKELITQEKAKVAARQFADASLTEIQAGKALSDIIEGTSLNLLETDNFTRLRGPTTLGGTVKGLLQAAFSLTAQQPLLLIDGRLPVIQGTTIIATLKERTAVKTKEFETQKEGLKLSIRLRKEGAAARAWREQARKGAKIVVNPTIGLDT